MTIDAAGDLWVAFWDGWCLRRFSPDGSCRETLQVPFQRPTSCAFAGPQLDRLVITSARTGLSENELATQPLAGALLITRPAVGGIEDVPFPGGAVRRKAARNGGPKPSHTSCYEPGSKKAPPQSTIAKTGSTQRRRV